jgi:hypothetical protein
MNQFLYCNQKRVTYNCIHASTFVLTTKRISEIVDCRLWLCTTVRSYLLWDTFYNNNSGMTMVLILLISIYEYNCFFSCSMQWQHRHNDRTNTCCCCWYCYCGRMIVIPTDYVQFINTTDFFLVLYNETATISPAGSIPTTYVQFINTSDFFLVLCNETATIETATIPPA